MKLPSIGPVFDFISSNRKTMREKLRAHSEEHTKVSVAVTLVRRESVFKKSTAPFAIPSLSAVLLGKGRGQLIMSLKVY